MRKKSAAMKKAKSATSLKAKVKAKSATSLKAKTLFLRAKWRATCDEISKGKGKRRRPGSAEDGDSDGDSDDDDLPDGDKDEDDGDKDAANEEDDEGEYAPIYPEKNIRGIDSNSLKRLNENNKEKDIDEDLVSTSSDDIIELKPNKNCDIKTEMKEMNDKINFILNKINSREDFNTINGSKDNVNKNLYDIILFILFGLFIILIFESINKLALRGSENFVCVPKIKLPEVTQ